MGACTTMTTGCKSLPCSLGENQWRRNFNTVKPRENLLIVSTENLLGLINLEVGCLLKLASVVFQSRSVLADYKELGIYYKGRECDDPDLMKDVGDRPGIPKTITLLSEG